LLIFFTKIGVLERTEEGSRRMGVMVVGGRVRVMGCGVLVASLRGNV